MVDKFSFKKGYRGRAIFRVVNVISLTCVSLMMIIPILKIVVDSLDATSSYGMNLIPAAFTFEAYIKIFTNKYLIDPFNISLITTIAGTALGLTLVTMGGFVIKQRDMPGNRFFTWFIFITMVFNGGLVPTYLLMRDIHLLDTLWSVILPLAINVYNLILMRSFFDGIPQSLTEAAEIDGCTPMGIFVKIILPLSAPALASIGLFFAVEYWNHYINFVLYITNTDLYNFQVKLREIVLDGTDISSAQVGTTVFQKTIENACVIVSMLPPMLIYPFCQKYFVQGVTLGAIKE